MRAGRRGPTMRAMSEPGHARFTLAIESKTDPVTGTVRSAGRAERPFTGWMELFSELEAAVSALRVCSGRAHTGIPSGEEQELRRKT